MKKISVSILLLIMLIFYPAVVAESESFNFDFSVDIPAVSKPNVDTPSIGNIDLGIDIPQVAHSNINAPLAIDLPDLSFTPPDITEFTTPAVQDFYLDLMPYLGEVQIEELCKMTQIQAADFANLQFEVAQVIAPAFSISDSNLSFNSQNGAITIDSSVLFDVDSYKLKPAGKDTVREAMHSLCTVLADNEYCSSVSRIIIAGHTDSDGSHSYNQTLSEKRAQAVLDFCLSDECGLDDVEWLRPLLSAQGFSYDYCIFNSDGSENKVASRRVEIRYVISLPN